MMLKILFVPTGDNYRCGTHLDEPSPCGPNEYCVRPDGFALDFCVAIGLHSNSMGHYRLLGHYSALDLGSVAAAVLLAFLARMLVVFFGRFCGGRPHRFPVSQRGPIGLVRRSIRHLTGRLHRPAEAGGATVDVAVFGGVPLERAV
uniref:Uncharacterized protein n=1 Tax=Ditylenchus dipsaci TaxID=166011 RepID=A0A915CZ42_9BILA